VTTTEVTPSERPSGADRAGRADSDQAGADGDIGWLRAILSGLAVLLVGFGGGLLGANAILTKALGLTRDARQWLATALFLAIVIVGAWALRWLQERGLI
jgi:hypothetical protein